MGARRPGRGGRGGAPARGRARRHARDASDPRWRAAALLHDVGKQVSGYGTVGRAVVTVVAGGRGRRPGCAAWAESAAPGRGRADGPLRRPRRARRRAAARRRAPAPRSRPGPVRTTGPTRWAGTGIPPAVCRALAAADGEPSPLDPAAEAGPGGARRRLNRNGPAADTRRVAYRPESPYFVRLDAPPPRLTARAAASASGTGSDAVGRSPGPRRRRRRRFRIRPVGVVLAGARRLGRLGVHDPGRSRRPGSATGSTTPAATSTTRASAPACTRPRPTSTSCTRARAAIPTCRRPRSRRTRTRASGSA